MIITVDYARFEQELRDTERLNHFKHTAELVFDQIQQREDDTGDTYELDGVTIASEWVEKTFKEIVKDIPSNQEIKLNDTEIIKNFMRMNYFMEKPYMIEKEEDGRTIMFFAFHEQDYNELLDDLAELIDDQIDPEIIIDEIDELIDNLEMFKRELERNEWKNVELEELAELIRDHAEETARAVENL